MIIAFKRLRDNRDLPLPSYGSEGASGMDLRADVKEPVTLKSLERALIPTGLATAIPPGYEGQVRARSGLALRNGIALANAPGTVDSDYRGEIGVILVNLGAEPFTVRRGDRIAQFVVTPVGRAEVVEAEALDVTPRGAGGFGSTGL